MRCGQVSADCRSGALHWHSLAELQRARRSAVQLLDLLHALASRHQRIPSLLFSAPTGPSSWAVYPAGGGRDYDGPSRYFFHNHGRARAPEIGHFHLFDQVDPDGPSTHLIGVGIDGNGLPKRLFMTNQWVTDDTPRSAAETLRCIRAFRPTGGSSVAVVNRYLQLILRVFAPQVRWVLDARDRRVHQASTSLASDRRVHLLSSVNVSLQKQFRDLDRAEEK